jgi:asparagine synthase (glutamine-hydrolysing)
MVLLKVDRASMHFSQEVRVPLLDKEVVETAARVDWQSCLSLDSKLGKQPLRSALSRHVNHQTVAKRGFESPMSEWLRGPLRERFEDLVIDRDEFFGQRIDRQALLDLYQRHLSGAENHARGLWPLLSLALWEDHHFRYGMQ